MYRIGDVIILPTKLKCVVTQVHKNGVYVFNESFDEVYFNLSDVTPEKDMITMLERWNSQ